MLGPQTQPKHGASDVVASLVVARWTLFAGNLALGVLTETSREMWNVQGVFVAASSFDTWRTRFEEKTRLGDAIQEAEEEDEELLDAFDALEGETSPLALRLVAESDGSEQDFGLLYLTGDRAGFRLL